MDLAEARERADRAGSSRHPWETARLAVVDALIARHTRLGPGAVVLDIGCGDTFVAEHVAAAHPRAMVFAVDTAFTDELIAHYRARVAHPNLGVFPSLEALPTIDRPASLILLLDVIEHVEDDRRFLAELVRRSYVGDETWILITVPAFQSLFCSHDRFLGHYRRYSNASLRGLVGAAGLQVEDMGYFFFSLIPIRLLQVLKERVAGAEPPRATTGLVTWSRGGAVARVMRAALVADASVARWLRRIGVNLAGLSNYAICRKSA